MTSYQITVLFEAEDYKTASELQNAIAETVNKQDGVTGCFEVLEPLDLDKKGKSCKKN